MLVEGSAHPTTMRTEGMVRNIIRRKTSPSLRKESSKEESQTLPPVGDIMELTCGASVHITEETKGMQTEAVVEEASKVEAALHKH